MGGEREEGAKTQLFRLLLLGATSSATIRVVEKMQDNPMLLSIIK